MAKKTSNKKNSLITIAKPIKQKNKTSKINKSSTTNSISKGIIKRAKRSLKPEKVNNNVSAGNKKNNLKNNNDNYNNKTSESTIKSNWDINKIKIGQFLSETCYYKVESFDKENANVIDQKGSRIVVSLNVLKDMVSADHFSQEVPLTMTALADLLERCNDDVFQCCFHKQQTVDRTKEILENINLSELTNKTKVNNLAKELISGDICTITCYLVKSENILGRSSVVDLNAPLSNNFRQIDHRTIEWIIYKNVKYHLKSQSEKNGEIIEHKNGDPLWDTIKLAVGDWFSSTTYYKIASNIQNDYVFLIDTHNENYDISPSILQNAMFNSSIYEREEKGTLTDLANLFKDAKSKVFTVCFNKKVDITKVKECLANLTPNILADSKNLAKQILTGEEKIVVGHLISSEAKLGRSLVVNLGEKGFASVDHRTIKWLILNNVKYFLK